MLENSMDIQRLARIAVIASVFIASTSWAQGPGADSGSLSSQYAGWAGGKVNADSLVDGLMSGRTITLVTTEGGRNVSLAGFTPAGAMSAREVKSALNAARQSLSRLGISRPTAEQIQAALIGGDILLRDGSTRQITGVVAQRTAPVAAR